MLSHGTYLAYAVEVRIGFLARRRQMKAEQADEALGWLRKEHFGVLKQLKELQMPSKQALMDRIKHGTLNLIPPDTDLSSWFSGPSAVQASSDG